MSYDGNVLILSRYVRKYVQYFYLLSYFLGWIHFTTYIFLHNVELIKLFFSTARIFFTIFKANPLNLIFLVIYGAIDALSIFYIWRKKHLCICSHYILEPKKIINLMNIKIYIYSIFFLIVVFLEFSHLNLKSIKNIDSTFR